MTRPRLFRSPEGDLTIVGSTLSKRLSSCPWSLPFKPSIEPALSLNPSFSARSSLAKLIYAKHVRGSDSLTKARSWTPSAGTEPVQYEDTDSNSLPVETMFPSV